ncbi:MAG: hypothetical protein ACYS8K_07010 [Planctomycetota bacterium]|jgi:endogenous inhibitor of DNA gyrase (YacG/DUF329 family)
MGAEGPLGLTYRCPVCGAEVSVLGRSSGEFAPRCCNMPMVALPRRVAFYFCPVCGVQIAVLKPGDGAFEPRCCNREMVRLAA